MKKNDISTPEQLDTALRANALSEQAQLWKVAEGRSFQRAEVLGLASAIFIIVCSLMLGFSQDTGGTHLIALGVLLLTINLYVHMHGRLSALAEIVKKLERERPSASHSA